MIAEEKTGDLRGIRSYDIYYNRINYELAYTLEYVQFEDSDEVDVVVVIMAGTLLKRMRKHPRSPNFFKWG